MSRIRGWLLSGSDTTPLSADRLGSFVREAGAGAIASIITIAHCLSYSALIFSGELRDGLGLGLWGFMAGAVFGCLITAALTSVPPALAGPRNPSIAVMSVLAATITASLAASGGQPASAVPHVLAALAIATALSALAMALIGHFRLGQIVRFIPHPVIAGFLVASGWLLIVGGVKVALGRSPSLTQLAGITVSEALRASLAFGFLGLVLASRGLGAGAAFLPALFIGGSLLLDVALRATAAAPGWFLTHSAGAIAWSPVVLLTATPLDCQVIASGHVEMLSIAGVAAIALLLDTSAIESQRRATADMDREFKIGGVANAAATLAGGFAVALAPNASRLIDEMGGRSRLAGLCGSVVIAAVLASGLDIARLVPTPILGGLLIYLGYTVAADALWKAPAPASRADLALSLAIAVSIVQLGYLTGIILGLIGACVLFALRYSRIDAVHRHVTRAAFASPAERSPDAMDVLRREGGRIHVYWLQGFIFFGSSNRIYEQIRDEPLPSRTTAGRWIILDLSRVSGIDTSALMSFAKLRTWAQADGVTLVVAGAPPGLMRDFSLRPTGAQAEQYRSFPTRSEALEWSEDQLLADVMGRIRDGDEQPFRAWLADAIGSEASSRLIGTYLQRRQLQAGEALCRQGEPSGSIEFIARGSVAVVMTGDQGREIRLRRMTNRTVFGEMGFFRGVARGASVLADIETVAYVLSREAYERLSREDPALAKALLEFVVRALADRVEFTNTEIAALV